MVRNFQDFELVRMEIDEVMDSLNVSRSTAEKLVRDACSKYASKPIAFSDMRPPVSFLGIDMLRFNSITEVYGPSGSGKTQLCFSLAASDKFETVYWLDTEGTYRSERLLEIGGLRCLEKVKVKQIRDFDSLLSTVSLGLPNLVTPDAQSVLVIIDSIAAPLRSTENLLDRQKSIHILAESLKKINACILVTNHVIGSMAAKDSFTPALGNTWSHAVNTRLLITKDPHTKQRLMRTEKLLGMHACDIEIGISRSGVYLFE